MRILHLIDPEHRNVGACVAALLAEVLLPVADDVEHSVLILGGSNAERLCHDVGVVTHDRIAPPTGQPWLALTPFRRYMQRVGPFDLVHCWSSTTASLASLASVPAPVVVTLASTPSRTSTSHWLRMLTMKHPSMVVTATSNSVKRGWAEGGVDPARLHVVRPGLDLSRVKHAERNAIRKSWGITSDKTLVVLAMGSPPTRIDATRFGRVLALCAGCDLDVAMVMHPDAPGRGHATDHVRASGGASRLILDSRTLEPWSILPACDAGMLLGDDTKPTRTNASLGSLLADWWSADDRTRNRETHVIPNTLHMHWAAAAGKIVIGDASYAVSEIVESSHSGLLVTPGDDEGLVRRIKQVIEDRHLAWSLADAARSEAFSFFSRHRFANDFVTMYRQIIHKEPVSVSDLPVTGGLRFAGRA